MGEVQGPLDVLQSSGYLLRVKSQKKLQHMSLSLMNEQEWLTQKFKRIPSKHSYVRKRGMKEIWSCHLETKSSYYFLTVPESFRGNGKVLSQSKSSRNSQLQSGHGPKTHLSVSLKWLLQTMENSLMNDIEEGDIANIVDGENGEIRMGSQLSKRVKGDFRKFSKVMSS